MKQAILILALLTIPIAHADFRDQLRGLLGGQDKNSGNTTTAALSNQDMVQGVLEALSVGVKRAVDQLGQAGGYLQDPQVRIPLPKQVAAVEKLARNFGQGKYVDQFVASMNHAAEQAVPVATDIFLKTIQGMQLTDAKAIVSGPNNAATEYFKTHTREQLHAAFLPIVRKATENTNVTAAYKQLVQRATPMAGGLLNAESIDLDQYVTSEALDGLFLKLADEEQRIRQDPVARSTELLKKVFGR